MQTLKSTHKKKILKQLKEQFGIKKLPHLLIKFGKERIKLYSGSLSKQELHILNKNLRIENIGLYFAKQEKDRLRLTLDGIQILKSQITKNILDIDDKQAKDWLKGDDLLIQSDKSFKILKNKNEFLGCGKSTGEKITNFVPKERRVR